MAAFTWTDADGVAGGHASDAPAMPNAFPASGFAPSPGPHEGPLTWPMAGGDAVGFAFRARDQYAAFTVPEIQQADAELAVRLVGHLADGGRARFLSHDRAQRSYLVDAGPGGSASLDRMGGGGGPRYQVSVRARNREPRNLLALVASPWLTADANADGVADGWTAVGAQAGITRALSVSGAGQRIVVSANAFVGSFDEYVRLATAPGTVAPGDVLTAAASVAVGALAGGANAHLALRFLDAGGTALASADASTTTPGRFSATGTAPAGTARAEAFLSLFLPASGATGDVTWIGAQIERAAAPSAFDASAAPGPFVVVY